MQARGAFPASGFIWDETDGIREISTASGATLQELYPFAINNSGQFAGTSNNGAFRGDLTGGVQQLQPLIGDTWSQAASINNSGVVVGGSAKTSHQATMWVGNSPVGLGVPLGATYSFAKDINDLGHVTGYLGTATGELPFFWSPETGMIVIPLSGANGFAINNLDQVVGGGAFLWDQIHGLQVLSGLSQAVDINDDGLVAGWSGNNAMIWDAIHGARDLNLLVPPNLGWHLTYASGVNNQGDIAAWGTNGTTTHGFFLRRNQTSNVPEPSTIALISMALLSLFGFGMMRGRAEA